MSTIDFPPLAIPLAAQNGELRGITLLDPEDAFWLVDWTWRLSKHGYAFRSEKPRGGSYKTISMARLLLGLEKYNPLVADHINRDKLDNRRANLRKATRGQNSQNMGSRAGSSRFRGVSWNRQHGIWEAYASPGGKRKRVGYFRSEEAAARAVSEFRKLHMPFSVEEEL